MKLNKSNADIYIPDGTDEDSAISRTTHLAIGAHQDDIEIMAYHGISECYGSAKQWFTGITTTNGAGSPRDGIYGDYTDEQMQEIRQKEQRKAANVGDYACMIQTLYSSSEIKDSGNTNTVDDLFNILSIAKPEVLYVHNPADKHDTHVATMLRALSAARRLPKSDRPKAVYGCEVWRDLDWLSDEDKVPLPVDKHPNLASALLGVFDSQISGGKRYDLATIGRRIANATFFASHETDACNALTYAMDLTPLIHDDTIDTCNYVANLINKFNHDVTSRLEKFI